MACEIWIDSLDFRQKNKKGKNLGLKCLVLEWLPKSRQKVRILECRTIFVVYFDQQMGVLHAIYLSK